MEDKLKQIEAREEALTVSLWKRLGEEGIAELAELLLPVSSFTPAEGYFAGYGENYTTDGVTDEMLAKDVYARRKFVNRANGLLRRIYYVGFPPVEEEKKKKTKKSFK